MIDILLLQLLLAPNCGVVLALCDAIDIADSDKIASSLIRVFQYHSLTSQLLQAAIAKEVNLTGSYTMTSHHITSLSHHYHYHYRYHITSHH